MALAYKNPKVSGTKAEIRAGTQGSGHATTPAITKITPHGRDHMAPHPDRWGTGKGSAGVANGGHGMGGGDKYIGSKKQYPNP